MNNFRKLAASAAVIGLAGLAAAPVDAQTGSVNMSPTMLIALDGNTGVSVINGDPRGVGVLTRPLYGLPTMGADALILSTGIADQLPTPGDPKTDVDGTSLTGNATDVTQVALALRPQAGATCVSFDFMFFSEEFPTFVNDTRGFNDVFTAELGTSNITIDPVTSIVNAPNNFATGAGGEVLSVNTFGGFVEAPDSALNGRSGLFTASSRLDLSAGNPILYLTIQDLGDAILDSSVVIDNLKYYEAADCGAGLAEIAPPETVPAATVAPETTIPPTTVPPTTIPPTTVPPTTVPPTTVPPTTVAPTTTIAPDRLLDAVPPTTDPNATSTVVATTNPDDPTTSTTVPVPDPAEPIEPSSFGDVHLLTPDGLATDFQQVGDFVALESAEYVFQARQLSWIDNPAVSINTGVAMTVGTDTIEFDKDLPESMFVNGEQTDFPTADLELPGGGVLVIISAEPRDVVVVLPNGNKAARVIVHAGVNIDYGVFRAGTGAYAGLLGNLDGNADNDITTRGGQQVTPPASVAQLKAWGDTWLASDNESLFRSADDEAPAAPEEPAKLLTVDDIPTADVEAAEATCGDAGITEQFALQTCVYDVGATGDERFVATALLVQEAQERRPATKPAIASGVTTDDGDGEGGDSLLAIIGGSVVAAFLLLAIIIRAVKKRKAS